MTKVLAFGTIIYLYCTIHHTSSIVSKNNNLAIAIVFKPPGFLGSVVDKWDNCTQSNEALCYGPTKQGTSEILGKMSFWYHCKEHTHSFNLIPKSSSYSYFLIYDHLYI